MIRHAGDIKEKTYRNVGLLMAAAYAVSVIPITFMQVDGDVFFPLLMTIPLFTILLAGLIGYHGHKKESLTALVSIVSSQFLFWAGIVFNEPIESIFVISGVIAFMVVPWLLFAKIFVETKVSL